MSKYSWEPDVLPIVTHWAKHRWRRDPDRDDKVCDAQSLAWEFFQAADERATPQSIAYYAIRHVAVGRQFQESARSITGPNPRRRDKPRRAVFDPSQVFRTGDDPARVAAFRDLYRVWLSTLSSRQRRVVELLATGERADVTAAQCGLSPGRISQIRRELEKRWRELGA